MIVSKKLLNHSSEMNTENYNMNILQLSVNVLCQKNKLTILYEFTVFVNLFGF